MDGFCFLGTNISSRWELGHSVSPEGRGTHEAGSVG